MEKSTNDHSMVFCFFVLLLYFCPILRRYLSFVAIFTFSTEYFFKNFYKDRYDSLLFFKFIVHCFSAKKKLTHYK